MKKLLIVLMGALFVASSAQAVVYSITPEAGVKVMDEFKTSAFGGVKVNFTQLPYLADNEFGKNVVVSTGIEYQQVEAKGLLKGKAVEADFYTVPVEIGYNYAITENLSVTPNVGVARTFANAENGVSASDFTSYSAGADLSYKINDKWSAAVGVDYDFGDVSVNGEKLSVSGPSISASGTYSF